MKHYKYYKSSLICFIIIFSLTSWSEAANAKAKEEYFLLKYLGNWRYQLLLFNTQKECVHSIKLGAYKSTHITVNQQANDIVQIHYSNGTGSSTDLFFQASTSLLSSEIEDIGSIENGINFNKRLLIRCEFVDYTKGDYRFRIILQDIFDDDLYYKEYTKDIPSAESPYEAINRVEFLGEHKVRLEYGGSYWASKMYGVPPSETIDFDKLG